MENPETSELNTNVPDKDERKKIRRRRIQERYETNKTEGVVIEDVQDRGMTGARQVAESFVHLDRRKKQGLEDVTTARVKLDENEFQRRNKDEGLRRGRLIKLQHEALSSAKANAAIEMKWAELLEKEIPQELYHEISQQMDSCKEVIKSKDAVIEEFQLQLRSADEEYVRMIRQEGEDFDGLLKRIRSEFSEMQTEYEKELDAIEDAFMEEREKIIADHSAEIEALFEKRRNNEVKYKETKQKREELCQKEIEELMVQGTDKYSKLKIDLELNIQTLKEQLEEIRATYQLNTEKLDYNYRVLTELDVEKNAELSRYKRRLTKLKDHLSGFVSKFHDMEKSDGKINAELTEDYRRLTSRYKNLQAKFRSFEVSDTQKFEELWNMHDEEAKDNVDQLLKADLIITEQQLGYRWQSPDAGALQAALQIAGTNSTKEEENESEAKETEQRNDEDDEDGEEVEETIVAMKKKNQVSGNKIRAMMKLLAKEAGFLVNPDVEKAIAGLPDTDAEVARAESLLKTLGVKDEEKMRALVDYFFVNTGPGQLIREQRDDDMDIGIVEGEREQEVDLTPKDIPQLRELRDVISAEDVISAIKMYMEDMSEAPMGAPTTKSDGANKRRQQAMKAYWHNLTQVVSDDSVEIWKQLERDMEVCKDVLERRARSVARVDSLNEKNVKLKQLLNTYLGDVQNDRMQVPPAQLMHVRPIPGSKTSKMAATKLAKTKEVDRKAVGKLMSQTQ